MKPFDLEAAKNGAPVLLELYGQAFPARIVCFDRVHKERPIVVFCKTVEANGHPVTFNEEESTYYFDLEGKLVEAIKLVMAPTKKQAWVNIYEDGSRDRYAGETFSTEVKAKSFRSSNNYLKTILIDEWEE